MARVLVVGGASRGVSLARALVADGHAIRVVANEQSQREAIDSIGAECVVGTPDRLATLSGALEHVTISCWLFADADGAPEFVRALHGSRLERFLHSTVDSTIRGFVYEAGGMLVPPDVLAGGRRIVSETAALNSIPVAILTADPKDQDAWFTQARAAVEALLEGQHPALS